MLQLWFTSSGRLAQLGERRVRNAEVGSSSLLPSTNLFHLRFSRAAQILPIDPALNSRATFRIAPLSMKMPRRVPTPERFGKALAPAGSTGHGSLQPRATLETTGGRRDGRPASRRAALGQHRSADTETHLTEVLRDIKATAAFLSSLTRSQEHVDDDLEASREAIASSQALLQAIACRQAHGSEDRRSSERS
jgi:hypothetical protein